MAFKGEDSKFSVATTVTLVLAVAAVVLVKAPLKSSRPSGNGIDLNGPTSVLKAHARLWEDPFAAVQKDLEARKHNGLLLMREGKVSLSVVGKGPTQSLTGDVKISSLLENIQSDGLTGLQNKIGEVTAREKQVTILLVMTRGGAYVDDSEWRIRDRYAVEAALEVGCFKSEQTQFLSYFTWNFKTDFGSRPFHTPYEWYRRSKIAVCQNLGEKIGERIVEGHDPQLLVLWLAAEESERSILQRIDALLTMVLKETHGAKISVQLVGPRSSSEFRALLKEIQGRGQTQRKDVSKKAAPFSWQKQSGRLTLYSPWATAMPGLLAYGLKPPIQEECNSYAACNKLFDEFLKDAGLDIRYSIGSDRVLFDSLFDELNRRRVIVGKDSIVLIGEWDSFYARALPLTFSAEACRHIGRCVSIEEAVDQFKRGAISPQDLSIKQYSYLSGLDGEVPENRASDFTSKGEKKAKEKEESGKTKIRDIASYEKPEGSSQLDYVRRLVARIKTEEQDNTDQKKKVKAIGILETDPYDALLILQAVREEFPTVLFFATDLDARYFHEGEQKWARNLLVVSHFGLQLVPELQRSIPPFRSSYQTSTFLAVQKSIGQKEADQYGENISPRLFEIGRYGAVDLSVDHLGKSIHPSRQDVETSGEIRISEEIQSLWIVAVVLFSLTIWSSGSLWNWLAAWDEIDDRARTFKRVRRQMWLVFPPLAILLIWCMIRHAKYMEDEPFSWFDGVSVWPTELLRMFAGLLCLFFLVKARADLIGNTRNLTARFFPSESFDHMTQKSWSRQLGGFCCNLDWMFHGSHQVHPRTAIELWAQYVQAHTWPQRVTRITLWLFLYGVTIWPVWMFLNGGEWRLFVPCRGEFSCNVDEAVTVVSVFLLVILNLAVLDAVLLCARWIHEIPAATGLHAMAQIRLIGERTRVVNYRILYPFVVLFLMIAARSHYFDKWDFPPALIMVLTVNCLLALASATLLYRAAIGAKRKVLVSIQEQFDLVLMQDQNKRLKSIKITSGPSSDGLRQIIDEIDAVQQGAFVPLYRQPIVQATLLAAFAFLQYWYLG